MHLENASERRTHRPPFLHANLASIEHSFDFVVVWDKVVIWEIVAKEPVDKEAKVEAVEIGVVVTLIPDDESGANVTWVEA